MNEALADFDPGGAERNDEQEMESVTFFEVSMEFHFISDIL